MYALGRKDLNLQIHNRTINFFLKKILNEKVKYLAISSNHFQCA